MSHRLMLALAAQKDGYEVHVATMEGKASQKIEKHGFFYHGIYLTRSGKNPFKELKSLFSIYRLLKKVRPTIVHLVTIKPILYGGFLTRFVKVPAVVAAISGLGYVFTSSKFSAKIMRYFVIALYRISLHHNNLAIIFQNKHDQKILLNMKAVERRKTFLIPGSGVNLKEYHYVSEPALKQKTVVMAARLLQDKGVFEFVEAANLLKKRGINSSFILAGDRDPGNPGTVSVKQIKQWKSEPAIKLVGFQKNIAGFFAKSNLVVLPSYREGLPKVLAEAAACGRAVITTDTPGCRDAIVPNKTGLLVPLRDSGALADAIEKLLSDDKKRKKMGSEGRKFAEQNFDIHKIIKAHLNIYRQL